MKLNKIKSTDDKNPGFLEHHLKIVYRIWGSLLKDKSTEFMKLIPIYHNISIQNSVLLKAKASIYFFQSCIKKKKNGDHKICTINIDLDQNLTVTYTIWSEQFRILNVEFY